MSYEIIIENADGTETREAFSGGRHAASLTASKIADRTGLEVRVVEAATKGDNNE